MFEQDDDENKGPQMSLSHSSVLWMLLPMDAQVDMLPLEPLSPGGTGVLEQDYEEKGPLMSVSHIGLS